MKLRFIAALFKSTQSIIHEWNSTLVCYISIFFQEKVKHLCTTFPSLMPNFDQNSQFSQNFEHFFYNCLLCAETHIPNLHCIDRYTGSLILLHIFAAQHQKGRGRNRHIFLGGGAMSFLCQFSWFFFQAWNAFSR